MINDISKILTFSEISIAKLLHDISSPIGAIYNGIELLEEDETLEMHKDILGFITSNSKVSINRLKFFRHMYCNNTGKGSIKLPDLIKIAEDYLNEYKINISWNIENPDNNDITLLSGRESSLLLTLIYLASESLIHKGDILIKIKRTTRKSNNNISVIGTGLKINDNGIAKIFENNAVSADLNTNNILPFLALYKAELMSVVIKSRFGTNRITFEF
jgi:histidine phosphotransferase ChpT